MVDRTKLLVLGGIQAAEVAAYLAWRPTMLRWGTEGAEATEPLPGDSNVPNPRFQSTRAITIDAPPERVWPWIVQMGIYRAGFYTHDRVERLFRARFVEGKHSATRIHPELQDLKVGDRVPYGVGVFSPVTELEPNRYLVAGEAFVLRPLPGNRTRFLIRYRAMGYLSAAFEGVAADAPAVTKAISFAFRHVPGGMLLLRGIDFFIGDPLHHYMEVGLLRGTRARGREVRRCRRRGPHGGRLPGARGGRNLSPRDTEATATPRPAAVPAIKVFHTLAGLSIESCVASLLHAGLGGRTDKRVGIAAAVVASERWCSPATASAVPHRVGEAVRRGERLGHRHLAA